MMRTKLSITEGIFPMPVLMVATYNEDGSVNVMNAAWGTMQERETVVLNLTETHKTVKNIKARGACQYSRCRSRDRSGLFRRGIREQDCRQVYPQRPYRQQSPNGGRPCYQRVPTLSRM